MTENPRITLDDGTLDTFTAKDVALIHFEAVDSSDWFATIQLREGEVFQLHFGARNPKAVGYARVEGLGVYPEQGRLV